MKRLRQVLLPLLILLVGVLIAAGFMATRPRAERTESEAEPPLVRVVRVEPGPADARVQASGVVQAARQVSVVPQVSGRIVKQSKKLRPGGRFVEGEVLARIDPRDYRLAIRSERSRVRQAELELELETGRQSIAEREWRLLGDEDVGDAPPLALRKPHLETAKRKLEAARSGLERAKLNLERTWLRAPFDAMVVSENLEVGQVVGPGGPVATLIGTREFWVMVSVPVERLALLDVPGMNGTEGSRALVTQDLDEGTRVTVEGRVIGLGAQLDPQTRTAQLLVAIEDPLEQAAGGVPILPGAFVQVEIVGRTMDQVAEVPRRAVVDGDCVWLVDAEGKLTRRKVSIAWRGEESVFVSGGLEAGERVVTTPLALPVEGMPVRIQSMPAGTGNG